MKTARIRDLARIVRSKNAGPYELTLDVFFKSAAIYRQAKRSGAINRELIRRLYHVDDARILDVIWFDPARAAKVTLARPVPSGSPGDTDVYGAQQHAPLLMAEVPWEP